MSIPNFPALVGLSYPIGAAPTWRTLKQEAISGKEYRIQLWTYPRRKYEIAVSYLGSNASSAQNQDWQALAGFFNAVAGAALPFHWHDPYDDGAFNPGPFSLGEGDGATTGFSFVQPLGGFIEPIQDVTAVSEVTIAGTPTSAYTLLTDPNFGLTYGLKFATPPASNAAIAASFTYRWPCRFDADSAEFSNFMYRFWELKKISFETMKVL